MCDCQRLHIDQLGQAGADVARYAWAWIEYAERHNGARPYLDPGLTYLLQLLTDTRTRASATAGPADFWLSVPATASVLGVTQARVRWLASHGRLPGATRLGRDWLIGRKAIEDYRRTRARAA